ncbi:MAG TPA: glycine oxidase ThiO [Streptosporangiaceae bacterium]|jgi:glycine oxidase
MTSAVIIGGGVIGLGVAWRAAQRGMAVTVADPAPGRGAGHVAAGLLNPVGEAGHGEDALVRLGLDSLSRYPGFVAELAAFTGRDAGLRMTGTLQVGLGPGDIAQLGELRALRESLGLPARELTGAQCRELEPMLDPAVRGGLLTGDDGSVDPRLLTAALLAAADRAGVRLIRQRVTEVITRDGRAAGARLAGGTAVEADRVVLAAGWSSRGIGGLPPGTAPPVRPVKGQILRLRPSPAGASLGGDGPLLSRSVRGLAHGSEIYLVPRTDGELVIGATQEELGPDTTVTAGGVWELLRDARALLPGISELEFAEASAGLRPGTPDNAPVLGPSALPGLVLATGHFRNGVLLTPVTADVIADCLDTGRLPALAAPFAATRFARTPAP